MLFDSKKNSIFEQDKREKVSNPNLSGVFGSEKIINENNYSKNDTFNDNVNLEETTSPVISSKDIFNEF